MRILPLLLILISFAAKAGVFLDVKVNRVIDGDTFTADLGCEDEVFCRDTPVRIRGIDTPEMRGKCNGEKKLAQDAKDFTKEFLYGEVNLLDCVRGKYFRLVCFVLVDKKNLGALLVHLKLARKYDGGKRMGWCK